MAKITKQRLEEIIQKALKENDTSLDEAEKTDLGFASPTAGKKPKEYHDVTKAMAKVQQTSGLSNLLQQINNRNELGQFFVKLIEDPHLSKSLSLGDVKSALGAALRHVQKTRQ